MNHFRVSLRPNSLPLPFRTPASQTIFALTSLSSTEDPAGYPYKNSNTRKRKKARSLFLSPSLPTTQKRELSKGVSKRRTSTGSETFSLNICLNANKFVLLSSFTLKTTICPKIWAKTLPRNVKSLLPVNVRHSKTKKEASAEEEALTSMNLLGESFSEVCTLFESETCYYFQTNI